MNNFLIQQRVYDSFRDIEKMLRRQEMIVAIHPDDLTDELRQAIAETPLTTLRESKFVRPGNLFVIHPGMLEDLNY